MCVVPEVSGVWRSEGGGGRVGVLRLPWAPSVAWLAGWTDANPPSRQQLLYRSVGGALQITVPGCLIRTVVYTGLCTQKDHTHTHTHGSREGEQQLMGNNTFEKMCTRRFRVRERRGK